MNILIQIVNYVVYFISNFFVKVVELCNGKKDDVGSEPLPKFELVEDVKSEKSVKTKKSTSSDTITKPVKQPKKVKAQPKQTKAVVDKVKTPKKSAKKKTGV